MSKEAEEWFNKEVEEWFNKSEYRNYQQFIEDRSENKWDVIELSDLPEILQAYADEQNKALIEKIEALKWDEVSFVGAAYNGALNDIIRHLKQLEK